MWGLIITIAFLTVIGMAVTVPQSKGLEFDDVFLVDYFSDSTAEASDWRVLFSFLEERAAANEHNMLKVKLVDCTRSYAAILRVKMIRDLNTGKQFGRKQFGQDVSAGWSLS